MGARSVGKTLDAIKHKWVILIRKFKDINDAVRRTGSGGLPGQQRWAYYDAMLDILRDDPNVFPVVEFDSLRPETLVNLLDVNESEEDEEDEVDQEGERRGHPRRSVSFFSPTPTSASAPTPATATTRRRQRLPGSIHDSVVASFVDERILHRDHTSRLFTEFNEAARQRHDELLAHHQVVEERRSRERQQIIGLLERL
ncbi:hypothetical protein BC941DRAFT_442724, partial [Chlamydoabsidia padenii]